jgi:glycosidase
LRITTLTSNHDTVRFMSLDGATVAGAMMHIAFTLSVRGIPQLYAGEEIGMAGGEDPDNRREFPGGFSSGSPDSHNAFSTEGRKPDEQRIFEWTRAWLRIRAEQPALRNGRLIDLVYDDDAYVFARLDGQETVVVAVNRQNQERQLIVQTDSIGLKEGIDLKALIGISPSARVANGRVTLNMPAKTVIAFKASRI